MLTGKQVRVRFSRDRIIPCYLDSGDPAWREVAETLLGLFRGQEGRTRGELDEDWKETFGNDPAQLVHQGLAKLLEDRCEFEVVSGLPPEEARAAVFRAAFQARVRLRAPSDLARQSHNSISPSPPASGGEGWGEGGRNPPPQHEFMRGTLAPSPPAPSPTALHRSGGEGSNSSRPANISEDSGTAAPLLPLIASAFDRGAVLQEAATGLGLSPEAVDQALFADLKSEQRLVRFKDTTADRLLERYNVALAQAVLLRSTGVEIDIRNEPPQRFRQLFRLVKFHRLVCEVEKKGENAFRLRLDGPLSLFASTQKYGLQLAVFLPALLRCQDFELRAELRWGPQRKPKVFTLSAQDGLVSHHADSGMYMPAELAMFVELFRKKVSGWEISEATEVFPLGEGAAFGFWVPDYRLVERASGRAVFLEVLGFWRRGGVERHLERLRQFVTETFVLAVSEQLHIDDAGLADLPAGIHRFRQMPLPDEIVQLAEAALLSGK